MLRAEALQEAEALVADRDVVDLDALRPPLLVLRCSTRRSTLVLRPPHRPLSVVTTIAPTRFTRLALDEERMAVLGVRLARRASRCCRRLLDIRARRAHAVLRLPHLRGRDHLHRLGDLARALHALDLVADFFRACHCGYSCSRHERAPQYVPFFLKSSIAAASAFSSSAVRSFVVSMLVHERRVLALHVLRAAPPRTPAPSRPARRRSSRCSPRTA